MTEAPSRRQWVESDGVHVDVRGLPPSIPFRYFGAAAVYHVLAWASLFAGANSVPRFEGGSAGRSPCCTSLRSACSS